MFDQLNEVMSSSSTVSWGAEQFNLNNSNVLRFTVCRFEKGTDYHSCISYEFNIDEIHNLIEKSEKFLSAEGDDWFNNYKAEILEYLNYEPEHTFDNQFDPPPSSPYNFCLIVKMMLFVSLFNKTSWKSRGVIESLKKSTCPKSNSTHLTFSTFLNQCDFFVSVLKQDTYESLKDIDKFGISTEDIFSNSEFMYSDNLDD
jgi:hypothetical protein